ncbi:MAG: ABC transporter substrate binding protein, partial [Arcobacteraceae bacterium]
MVWVEDIKSGIYSIIDRHNKDNVFHIENMDTKRHLDPNYYKTLASFYKSKYENIKFDLIFASDNNAFDFLKTYRNDIFGDVPVVFGGVNNFDLSMLKNTSNYTGVSEKLAFEKNIELILKIHPNIKNIFVINDYLKTGRLVESQMKRVLKKYESRVNIIYNKDESILDLRRDVSKLQDDTVILMGVFFSDKENMNMSYEKVGDYILDLSRVPIYCLLDFNISNKVIGGYVINGYSQGALMANIANKILSGIPAKSIKILNEETNQYIFNGKALTFHNIDKKTLPYNSKIINKQISYYEQFKDMISINILIILVIILIYIVFKYKQNIFNEKGILKILVYGPMVFLPLIIGTLIYNLVEHNQKRFQNEIATLKVEYLKEQQDIAYNEIEKINKYISSIQKQMTNDLK